MAAASLDPALAPVAFLVGEWEGPGAGEYPTIDDFAYIERLTFAPGPKPFLTYLQRTRAADGSPMHTETGYVRVAGAPTEGEGFGVEMVIAQPTGVAEVLSGRVVDHDIELRSTTVALTPTAKSVEATTRRFQRDGDTLVVEFHMAAVGEPLTFHLRSELARVTPT